jgi:hypothetical protein
LKRLMLSLMAASYGCDYTVGHQTDAPKGWCASVADCPAGDYCAQGAWPCGVPPNCSGSGPCAPYCGACISPTMGAPDAGPVSDAGTINPDAGTAPPGFCATVSDCPAGDTCAQGEWICPIPPNCAPSGPCSPYCGVCLAPPTDGGVDCGSRPPDPPDAGLPVGMGCGFPDGDAGPYSGNFPLLAKCCATTSDCAIGVYEWICCGQTFAVGINAAEEGAFAAALAQWQCAGCACAAGGELAEDGKVGTPQTVTVSCDNGWCMTHGP